MDLLKLPNEADLLLKDLTDDIINKFYKVYNALGYGFLEQVYQNALYLELTKGHDCKAQFEIDVRYENLVVGKYKADILVDNQVILELKAAEEISNAHVCQLQNYLKATDIEVGLLLNFGRKPEFRRRIFRNQYK